MEFSRVFYKDIPLDEDNIFSGNLYAISGLSVDQGITPNVSLPNVEGKKALSNILRTCAEEKNKFNFDLKNYREDYFDITVPFVKRTDVLINGFKYYDTTTQKEEKVEFYNYHYHLKNFGFTWEHKQLQLKYEITLSSDEKNTKKIFMGLYKKNFNRKFFWNVVR